MTWGKDREGAAAAPKADREVGADARSPHLGLWGFLMQTDAAAGGTAQGRSNSSRCQNLVQTQLPGPTPELLIWEVSRSWMGPDSAFLARSQATGAQAAGLGTAL